MKTFALRLRPDDDFMVSLDIFAQKHHLEAAFVLTFVGSLRKVVLRFANQEQATTLEGHFEIVSLTGVLSIHGSHYHIAIADSKGQTYGAHLLEGSEIYTTAEIVLGSLDTLLFARLFAPQTICPELNIQTIS